MPYICVYFQSLRIFTWTNITRQSNYQIKKNDKENNGTIILVNFSNKFSIFFRIPRITLILIIRSNQIRFLIRGILNIFDNDKIVPGNYFIASVISLSIAVLYYRTSRPNWTHVSSSPRDSYRMRSSCVWTSGKCREEIRGIDLWNDAG